MAGTRKIAAILVADIVGYSRLAGADEDRTPIRPLRSSAGTLTDACSGTRRPFGARGADRVASQARPDANFFGTSMCIRSEPLGHQIRKVASEYSLDRQRNSTGWSRRSMTPF